MITHEVQNIYIYIYERGSYRQTEKKTLEINLQSGGHVYKRTWSLTHTENKFLRSLFNNYNRISHFLILKCIITLAIKTKITIS